jgi:hypothetical protein
MTLSKMALYTESCYAECHKKTFTLIVVRLNVVVLNVVAPQYKTWAEFSTLDRAARVPCCDRTNLPILKLKTRPKLLLGSSSLDVDFTGLMITA